MRGKSWPGSCPLVLEMGTHPHMTSQASNTTSVASVRGEASQRAPAQGRRTKRSEVGPGLPWPLTGLQPPGLSQPQAVPQPASTSTSPSLLHRFAEAHRRGCNVGYVHIYHRVSDCRWVVTQPYRHICLVGGKLHSELV